MTSYNNLDTPFMLDNSSEIPKEVKELDCYKKI